MVAAPLYNTPVDYPTSPLLSFPPPSPNDNTPLRVRCGVTMRLQLATQGLSPVQAVWSPKGHVQPHRSHLPRRRHVKRFVMHDTDDEVPVAKLQPPAVDALSIVDEAVDALAKLDIYAPAPQQNAPHLQEVIPRLILGFLGAEDSVEDLQASSEKPFSHIISVVHGDATTAGSSQCSSGPGLQRLYLFIAPRDATSGRAGLGLTDAQLRRARDYIGEIIPTPESVQNPADYLRILITTPHGLPTNALCVLACYLAFISDKKVEEILNFIDEEEDYLSAWKGEVSEDEIERVEKIARAWSCCLTFVDQASTIQVFTYRLQARWTRNAPYLTMYQS